MKIRIYKKCSSKTGKSFVVLTINDIFVTFDVVTICKVADISPNRLSAMNDGDVIELN